VLNHEPSCSLGIATLEGGQDFAVFSGRDFAKVSDIDGGKHDAPSSESSELCLAVEDSGRAQLCNPAPDA